MGIGDLAHRTSERGGEGEESSSQSLSSWDDTGPSSEEEPERGDGDTVPGRRSEWAIKGAEEMSDEQGFELLEARASKRLAKREFQRNKERERLEQEARAKEEE